MGASKKRAIVVGGGFAGLRACRELSRSFEVTLIDSKDHFEFVPAALKCCVEPDCAAKYLVRFPKTCNHKCGKVVGLQSDGQTGEVELHSGEKLSFDYLILCTGSSYPGKFIKTNLSKADRLHNFKQTFEALEAAHSVVIVGGGAVGVELAAEIAEKFSGKQIALVTGGSRIVERMNEAVSKYATKWLEDRGVQVLCGQRVTGQAHVHGRQAQHLRQQYQLVKVNDWGGLDDGPGAATLTLSGGKLLQGDWVVKAVGIRPATQDLAASLGNDRLNNHGAICVEPTLQVIGLRNVFAAGDVTNVAEEKTAFFAELAGLVAAENVARLDKGRELKAYSSLYGGHKQLPFLGGLSLGQADGAFEAAGDVQTGTIPSKMRSIIEFISLRAAAGSWFFGKLAAMMKQGVVMKLTTAANKCIAATAS